MASPYETANTQARPDKETTLELSDGAMVIIPAGAASEEVEIVLERNPDKAKTMPALGEYTVPVSSFYNIEPKGEGLVGPVEIQLPVDRSLIPEGMDGELVALFPDGKGGWRSEPVDEFNGKAVVFTDDLGDPIIAWYFHPIEGDSPEKTSVTLEQYFTNKCKSKTFLGIGMDSCIEKEYQNLLEEMKKVTPLCEPRMALQAVAGEGESGSQVQVIGHLASPYGKIMLDAPEDAFANLPVEIKVNYRDVRETPKSFQVNTDSKGRFQLTLDASSPDSGLKEGWNWIFASAICPAGNNYAETLSKGYAEFKLQPRIVEAAEPAPAAEPTQPPEGAVAVPDVTGLSLDEAIARLEEFGFRTTWIDGKSPMELGQIYQQKPAAGEYFIPHRTTVVVYRNSGKQNNCSDLTLTVEECSNNSKNRFLGSLKNDSCSRWTDPSNNFEFEVEIEFFNNKMEIMNGSIGPVFITFLDQNGNIKKQLEYPRIWNKVKTNTYEFRAIYNDDYLKGAEVSYIVVFNKEGYTFISKDTISPTKTCTATVSFIKQ
jgi:hypothetical protein